MYFPRTVQFEYMTYRDDHNCKYVDPHSVITNGQPKDHASTSRTGKRLISLLSIASTYALGAHPASCSVGTEGKATGN